MENELVVEVEGREQKGKNSNRRLRRNGLVPGIVGEDVGQLRVAHTPRRLTVGDLRQARRQCPP